MGLCTIVQAKHAPGLPVPVVIGVMPQSLRRKGGLPGGVAGGLFRPFVPVVQAEAEAHVALESVAGAAFAILRFLSHIEPRTDIQLAVCFPSFAHPHGAHGGCQRVVPLLEDRAERTVTPDVVEIGIHTEKTRFLQCQAVVQVPAPVARAVHGFRKGGRRAPLEELFVALAHVHPVGHGSEAGVEFVVQVLVCGLVIQVHGHAPGGGDLVGHSGGRPVSLLAHVPRLVHVVQVAHQRVTPAVGEAQQEGAGQVAVLRAARRLHVGDIAPVVLRSQVHVHHEAARLHVMSQCFAHVRLFLIHFQVLHRVIGQVVHQHLLVAPEERARTQQQLVHLAPVHENLALVVHRHARKLPDERVQHRAVRKLERVCVVHNRIALVVHLHLRGRHLHLVQVNLAGLAHLQCRHVHVFWQGDVECHPLPGLIVTFQLGTDQVFSRCGLD